MGLSWFYFFCAYFTQLQFINQNTFSNKPIPELDWNPKHYIAYHFDATKFGLWLKEKKCQKVKHIVEDIETIEQDENGIKSLNKKHNKPRLKVGPKGLENDMHYAIRMDYKNIKQLYSKCGKATDIYKAVSQMYQRVYKARKRWVEAYLYDLN